MKPPRARRTRDQLVALEDAILAIVKEEQPPLTARHLFYRAVGKGLVEKTEQAYKGKVLKALYMRRRGKLDWDAVIDRTRSVRRPYTFGDLAAYVDNIKGLYRRDRWQDSDQRVGVLVEKDALAGVIEPVTDKFQVPLMVSRGDASDSFVYEMAQYFSPEKRNFLYCFTDHDPQGTGSIVKAVERKLRTLFGCHVTVIRAALTMEQIRKYKLPTRPTKRTSSQAKHFRGRSVELDALPPDVLRELVTACISRHIDPAKWQQHEALEMLERQHLSDMGAH